MKTNFSLLFYLKKPKNYQIGLVPIYLRITVNGKRSETTTGRECDPSLWNSITGRLKGTKEDTKSFNAYLDTLQKQVYEAHSQLTEAKSIITAETLRDRLLGKSEKTRMLIDIFKDHNKKVATLVGKEYAAGTSTRYQTSLKHTQEYLQWQYKVSDIDIKKIDHDFIANYEFYLRSERNCSNNSAFKYIKNFKKIVGICLSSGWLDKDPFINYKIRIKQVDRVFLNSEDLQLMADKAFSTERLNQVRDIFLFCCFTGLAYADVKDHPHIHIVYNRVNNNGKTISDNFQKQRNVQVAKELTLKHGLYLSPGKERINRQQLKGKDKIKYELFDAIKAASKKVKNINELKQVLAKQGIVTHLKFKSGTMEVQGISFSKGEYKFKGSEIDRSLSYAKLNQAIEQQQVKPEKSLADQLREAMENAKQERESQEKTEKTTYLKPEPETHYLRQSLSAGADLLGGLLSNIADDDDSPERRRRKKNEQQQSRGTSR